MDLSSIEQKLNEIIPKEPIIAEPSTPSSKPKSYALEQLQLLILKLAFQKENEN